jgi:protoheme IX farnesyltransferase
MARAESPSMAADLLALTKPGVTRLVVFTSAVGMWLAPEGSLTVSRILFTMLGTVGVVAGANTLNMYLERDIDGRMERTRDRPLPTGRLAPSVALAFGIFLSLVSVPLLSIAVNPLTGALAALALLSYVGLYTPLKQRSWVAVWVGAVPGAMPPLMGWTAATGTLGTPGLVLFLILMLWQVPHTLAITLFRHDDYAGAGFQTLPVQHGARATQVQILWSTCLLVVSSLGPWWFGFGGVAYLVAAVVLGAGFLGGAAAGLRPGAGVKWARGLFAYSLVYLTVLLGVLLATAGHVAA